MTIDVSATSDTGVVTIGREDFLADHWDYRAGEHVTVLGPTGWGKTHLSYQLLEHTVNPKLPAVILVMKPRDETVSKWDKRLGFRRVRQWPPGVPWPPTAKPSGWTLWPKHTFDPEIDDQELHWQFRKGLLDSYKKGNRIVFCDEVAGLTRLGMKGDLVAVWERGRSMETGLWAASQRPVDVPLHAYSQAEHLFLGNDPDVRAQQRYGEIGGIDPKLVIMTCRGLRKRQWLYIRRTDRAVCIVDK